MTFPFFNTRNLVVTLKLFLVSLVSSILVYLGMFIYNGLPEGVWTTWIAVIGMVAIFFVSGAVANTLWGWK